MSSESWKDWVTEQRQEFSQRVKSAHLTRESGSSSWATPNTMDHMAQRSPEALQRQFETTRKGRTQPANLREQVHPQNWPTPRAANPGSRPNGKGGKILAEEAKKNWPTARARDWKDTPGCAPSKIGDVSLPRKVYGLQDQANPNTNGNGQESWSTPQAKNWPTPTTAEGTKIGNQPNFGQVGLSNHPSIVGQPDRAKLKKSGKSQGSQQWPTPRVFMHKDSTKDRGKSNLGEKVRGKLNPDWVEQLMGLPVGWTDLGSWATE
jgi:hypothetical protein